MKPRQMRSHQVLVTRSEPGASQQATALRAEGLQPITLPLIEITPLSCDPCGATPEIAIVLSAHAVHHGKHLVSAWGTKTNWLAVGSATASALSSQGIDATSPDESSSEGLLALTQLRECVGTRISILCGESPRPLLKKMLTQRGACVSEYPVYKRTPLTEFAHYHDQVREARAAIVFSLEGLDVFAALWKAASGTKSVMLCVNSRRAQCRALQLGFDTLRLLSSQSHEVVAREVANWLSQIATQVPTGDERP